MDHPEVNRRFVADFLAAAAETPLIGTRESTVLDLGTGTAQIPIELVPRRTAAAGLAIDLAAEMLRLARENVARAGLAGRVVLELVDAKRLPLRRRAVRRRDLQQHRAPHSRAAAALAEAVRVVAPAGLIFVRDLARPRDNERCAAGRQVRRRCECASAGPVRRFTAGRLERRGNSRTGCRAGIRAESVRATSDRHWTWCGGRTESR